MRAIAYKNGWEDSPVASATFTITGTVAAVQFDPPAGSYDSAISVSLTSATAGAEIWYTVDGSQPAAGKGTKYAGPVTLEDSATVAAVAVKQNWAPSAVASASYAVQVVPAVSDEEIMEARNAIARAKEVDADYYDPDNYTAAQGLLEDALTARAADPAGAREKLAASTEKANLAFDNSVERGAADLARRMEAARQRLLALEADKFLPSDYDSAVAGIGEAQDLYAEGSFADARARAHGALRDMTDLANRLEKRQGWVRQLKRETEQYMKEAEDSGAYADAPGQKEKVTGLYLEGVEAYQSYDLDMAEEKFGAAREAAEDTLRLARREEGQQAGRGEGESRGAAAGCDEGPPGSLAAHRGHRGRHRHRAPELDRGRLPEGDREAGGRGAEERPGRALASHRPRRDGR